MGRYKPTVISYSSQGLTKDKNAFVLADDAYQQLENAYAWRGRLLRRSGYSRLGRLRRTLTTVTGANTITDATTSFNLYTELAITGEPNAAIQPGTLVVVVGAPGSETLTDNNGNGTLDVAPGTNITAASVNYATGVVSITTAGTWAASTLTITVSYYPSLPTMGLDIREATSVNDEQTIGFDTKYAYLYDGANEVWNELNSTTATTWNGTNSDFFWVANYFRTGTTTNLVATNFNLAGTPDPIRWHNGTTWATMAAVVDAGGNSLHQARIIVPYKGYLVALNTYEGATLGAATQNPQRARWNSAGENPFTAANTWRSDSAFPGRGGFTDAPVSEQIISAEFVRDILVVYFERSTWVLRFTGQKAAPFVWERINRELGAESPFSLVPFDDGILAVGDKAITICNGNQVKKIDQAIPDEVYNIHNDNDGPFRVHGIRDFITRQVYWTFGNAAEDGTFPNRLLVYNYESGAWAIFTDSFTCLGTDQRNTDTTWQSLPDTQWREANFPWNTGGNQSKLPRIIAGNQQGYTFVLNQQVDNVESLSVTAVTAGTPARLTVPNHNYETGQVIKVVNCLGLGSALNNGIYRASYVDADNIDLQVYNASTNNWDDQTLAAGGTYSGLGEVIPVMNFKIRSKKFNMLQMGSKNHLGFIDFLMDVTQNGEISCYMFRDYNDTTPVNYRVDSDPEQDLFYNNVVPTSPSQFTPGDQLKQWHRFYCQMDAQFVEYLLTFSDSQMATEAVTNSAVSVDAIVLYSDKGGRLVE